MYFRINAKAEGKPRPRVTRIGTFTPVTEFHKAIMQRCKPLKSVRSEAYSVNIVAAFERPKSHYLKGKKTSHLLNKRAPYFMTSKPDCDNIEKAVLDAITKAGIIHEDAAVIGCVSFKQWLPRGQASYCDVTITPLKRPAQDLNTLENDAYILSDFMPF